MSLSSCVALVWLLGAAPGDTAPWPTQDWPISTPTARGLDEEKLAALVNTIRDGTFPRLHSLLIVRHGYLVLEKYFAGHERDQLHTLQSVSKSFTSAVVGIAVGEKKLTIDDRVLDFFPDLDGIDNIDERKRSMTVEDLLTMRSGTDYHERGPDSPHFQLNRKSRGWTEFILSRPMVREPGTHFQYDSGAVILTSSILRARTGHHADRLMEEGLFKPLGIERFRWFKNAEGHPHTGGGLHLTPRDMAKFGLLYLRGGKWEDRQVVPADWVQSSVRRHVEFSRPRSRFVGYGYWWWVLPPDPDGAGQKDIFAACGFRAQYIFVVPEHDLVVVVTGGTQNSTDQGRPVGFLYSYILPALQH